MALPPKWYQFLVSLFASLGSALYGYDLGVIAGVVASKNFKLQFAPTAAETGAVVSVFTGGAFFGAGFAGPIGDWLGRKKTILMGSLIFILGGGLQTGAQSLNYFYAGRGECKRCGHAKTLTDLSSPRWNRCRLPSHDYPALSSRIVPSR